MPEPGATHVVLLDDVAIRLLADGDGTWRLPYHPILRQLMHRAGMDMDELLHHDAAERRWVYQNIGYTLGGYLDIYPETVVRNAPEDW